MRIGQRDKSDFVYNRICLHINFSYQDIVAFIYLYFCLDTFYVVLILFSLFFFLNKILHQEYNTDLLLMLTFKNIINVMFVIKYSMLVLERSVSIRDSIFCYVNGEISVGIFDPVQHSADPDRGHL